MITLPHSESTIVICPWCGDVWARLEGPDASWWRHRAIPCLNHPQAAFAYGCDFGGSLLEVDETLIDILPASYLRREFTIHLAQLQGSL